MHKIQRFESTVLDTKKLTHDTIHLTFSVPKEFFFDAGQFIAVVFEKEGKEIRRPYSIASSPDHRGTIDLMVKKVEGGTASVFLNNLKKNDKITFMGPYGEFTLNDMNNEAVFIATGVSVAPFRAMINSLLKKGCKERVFLFLSVKYEDEFVYEDEWNSLEKKYPHFRHFVSVTRPSEKFKGNKGRVHVLVDHYLPSGFNGDFYLCGTTLMVEECEKNLIAKGVSQKRIFFEKYG